MAYDALKLGALAAVIYGVYDWRNRGKKIEEYEKDIDYVIGELNMIMPGSNINKTQLRDAFTGFKNKYVGLKNSLNGGMMTETIVKAMLARQMQGMPGGGVCQVCQGVCQVCQGV